MKKWSAIILVILLVFNTFNEYSIFVSFKLNQNKLTELFCINKDKPELKCNGKCHLSTVIESNQENEESPYSNTNETREASVLFIELIKPYNLNALEQKNSTVFKYIFPLKENDLKSVFHPPKG